MIPFDGRRNDAASDEEDRLRDAPSGRDRDLEAAGQEISFKAVSPVSEDLMRRLKRFDERRKRLSVRPPQLVVGIFGN